MLRKLVWLGVLLAAVVVAMYLDSDVPRRCPSCGTNGLVVVHRSVGSSTQLQCSACGAFVRLADG